MYNLQPKSRQIQRAKINLSYLISLPKAINHRRARNFQPKYPLQLPALQQPSKSHPRKRREKDLRQLKVTTQVLEERPQPSRNKVLSRVYKIRFRTSSSSR